MQIRTGSRAKVARLSDPLRKENLAGTRDGNFKCANAPLKARASHRSARYICIKFERAVNRPKRDDIAQDSSMNRQREAEKDRTCPAAFAE